MREISVPWSANIDTGGDTGVLSNADIAEHSPEYPLPTEHVPSVTMLAVRGSIGQFTFGCCFGNVSRRRNIEIAALFLPKNVRPTLTNQQ
jgi:hypothetical protein